MPCSSSVLAKPVSSTGPGNCGFVRSRALIRVNTWTSRGPSGRSAGAIPASTPPGRSTRATSSITVVSGCMTTRPIEEVTTSTEESRNGSRSPSPRTHGPGPRPAAIASSCSEMSSPTTVRPGRASSRDIAPEPQARSTTVVADSDTARASHRYGEWSPAIARERTASMIPVRSAWNSERYARQSSSFPSARSEFTAPRRPPRVPEPRPSRSCGVGDPP